MLSQLSPWHSLFEQPARLPGSTGSEHPAGHAGSAVPPPPPVPPVDRRPQPNAEPPRRGRILLWLTWQMPAHLREPAKAALRQTFAWRQQHAAPLEPLHAPHSYVRFGPPSAGLQVMPADEQSVQNLLMAEMREIVRTLEDPLSRTQENWRIAMHSIRLSQLCLELELYGVDVAAVLRSGLERLRVPAPRDPRARRELVL